MRLTLLINSIPIDYLDTDNISGDLKDTVQQTVNRLSDVFDDSRAAIDCQGRMPIELRTEDEELYYSRNI